MKRTVWIAEHVLYAMKDQAIASDPLETGGVLLGYWPAGSSDAVATQYVGPGPGAIHTEKTFEPDYEYQLAEIARLYEASGRTLQYLGDWHTHPGGTGYLSHRDHATFLTIAGHKEARASEPVMVILAG